MHVVADALTSVLGIVALVVGLVFGGVSGPADGDRRRGRHPATGRSALMRDTGGILLDMEAGGD